MSIISEDRLSDSPYVESIMYGRTLSDGSTIRPAERHWHMVFIRQQDRMTSFFVAPLTKSGIASWERDADILWIKFKLGTFMPHMPARNFLDTETVLPDATSQSFWLKGSAWQFPDHENADTFVNRLVHNDVLMRDPIVDAVLQDQPHDLSSRTVRHRFLHATGMTQSHIRQVERAYHARDLLAKGVSILDTTFEVGYFDQPHLTRALKHWIGYTPAQIIRMNMPFCHSVQDPDPKAAYHTDVLEISR